MSNAALNKTSWYGFQAWQLENQNVRLIVVPEVGGKLVSLFDKSAGYEWLVSPEQSHPFTKLDEGMDYNSNQSGGWNEMFPTIVACPYPAPGEWQGIHLPDHGEVWTLAWTDTGTTGDHIQVAVEGKVLPYHLARTVSLAGPRQILFEYKLQNRGGEPLYYLWAAHPHLACQPGAEIVLPPHITEVINVLPLEWGEEWGPPGTWNAWPGQQNVVGSPDWRRGRKFYIPPEAPIDWAVVRQPTGCWLRLEWDAAALAYCGVWIDEGCLNKVPDVAVEPTTGYYDDLSLAWRNRRIRTVEPGGSRTWQLAVHLGQIL